MAYVFQGRYRLANMVMDATPHWFVHLDAHRDILHTPDSLVDTTIVTGAVPPYRWVTTRMVAVPGSGANIELPVDVFWRLAQPLYLQAHNERLVVHRGRLLLADVVRRLSTDRTPLFGSMGDPVRIVRSGVPLAVVPLIPSPAARRPGARTTRVYVPPETHETIPGRIAPASFAPIDLALAVAEPPPYRWTTGFVSETYRFLGIIDHQLVHYVRAGSRHVDVYASWARPPRCAGRGLALGLIVLDSTLHEQHRDLRTDLAEDRRDGFNSVVRAGFSRVVAPGTYLYSLELLDPGCRQAARTRYWIRVPPAEGAFISDLMLTDELFPNDTGRVAQRVVNQPGVTMSASSAVRPGGTVRFYWEVYGVAADTAEQDRLAVTLEVVDMRRQRVSVSELGAVAEEIRRTRGTLAITHAQSVPPGAGPLGSGIAVALPPGMRGLHVARVTVRDVRTGRAATAERAFYARE
jgi:hypothetical protein